MSNKIKPIAYTNRSAFINRAEERNYLKHWIDWGNNHISFLHQTEGVLLCHKK